MQRLRNNLSYSEKEVARLLSETIPDGGTVVMKTLLEVKGISRSSGVNTLKKMGMAGIVETASMGRQGTFIRVLNKQVWQALKGTV